MTNPEPMIEVAGLTKRFGARVAIAPLDLTVARGCAFGLLGHNGAGKTTLIRMLVGLTRPDAGTIRIGGRALEEDRAAVLARVGAIVEEPHFHAHLTARENLRVAAAVRGPAARARIEPVLERMGLRSFGDERVSRYSQGMRQRLGIARCLLADPELLILDEPANGLDPWGILELRSMIGALSAEGRTVVVSSHLLDEIEKTCQAAAVLDRGRLIAHGPIGEIAGPEGFEIEIGCDDVAAAIPVLAAHPAVVRVRPIAGGVRAVLSDEAAAGAVGAALVDAGIHVSRSVPVRASLEDRFLAITSRLGARS